MQYKTIILEFLKERPQIHDRLRKNRKLLAATEAYAKELKTGHEAWKELLSGLRPGAGSARRPGSLEHRCAEAFAQRLEVCRFDEPGGFICFLSRLTIERAGSAP